MKVLWLSHLVPFPPKAGVIQRSYHLIKQLSLEFDVDLLAFHQPRLMAPLVDNLQDGLEEAREELGKFCNIKGVFDIPSERSVATKLSLAFRGAASSDGYTLKWIWSLEYFKKLNDLISSTSYDLVHLDTISFAPYHSICAKFPIVLDHHNIESHMMRRRAEIEKNPFKKAYFLLESKKIHRAELRLASSVQMNITCSDTDSARLLNISPSAKSQAVPNGVDTDFYLPARLKIRPKLLFIGTMSWYPNIQAVEFIIRELSGEIAKRWPHISIDIVGAGAPQYLRDMAEKCSNVHMHGFLEEIKPIMNEAMAFICPIVDGGGTKLKLLDAMSMELPIIAHPVACEGIALKHRESVLLATTCEEYISSIQALVDNPEMGRLIGANARKLAESEYSVNAVGHTLRSVYKSVAGV